MKAPRFGLLVVGLALAAAASGCAPIVAAVSVAPPTRSGAFWIKERDGEDTVFVSKGVAMALECRDVWWGGPCENARASTGDVKVARVLSGHLEKEKSPWGMGYADQSASQRSVFVLAGVEAGTTWLRFDSDDGSRVFRVVVEP